MKGFVVGLIVGFIVALSFGASEPSLPGSSPLKPLDQVFVRGLTVVDEDGIPRIILRQNERASWVAVKSMDGLKELVSLSVSNLPSASMAVRPPREKPHSGGGIQFDGQRVVVWADNLPH